MKKIIIFAILSFGLFAETVKVDLDSIIAKHPKFEIMKTDLEKEKTKLQEVLDIKQNELNTEEAALEAKGDKVTEEEAVAFYKKEQELQNLFAQAQTNLSNLKNQKMQSIYTDILNAIEILYKEKKYTAIIDSEAIIQGKDNVKDVSDEVVKLLKGTEKISLF